jgi:hypothetical protein
MCSGAFAMVAARALAAIVTAGLLGLGGGGSGACSSVTGSSTFFSISPISAANNANSSSMITARPRGMASRLMTSRLFVNLQASRTPADRWSCDSLRQIQFGAEIFMVFALNAKDYLLFPILRLIQETRRSVIPSRAQQ